MSMQFNKYQTELTDEVKAKYPDEVVRETIDYLENVEFIKRLISPDRKYAKDLERDSQGRIIVDLANPHIIENSDYFRETAIHYEKHGCFTKLRVNTSPKSEYMKWFKREIERCWKGMVRPEDGEWITGDMYFYLNYTPFEIINKSILPNGKVKTSRSIGFPKFWEGVYWRFHYMDQARNGGIYNDFKGNQHGGEIARRGASKSFCAASKLTKNFILGIDEIENTNVKSVALADNKEFLGGKDGILKKFTSMVDWLIDKTEFPNKKLTDSFSDMLWTMGWKDSISGQNKGSLNEVMGISIADNPDKPRGKRCAYQIYEEFGAFPSFLETYAISQPNVELGEDVFGFSYLHGTGGSKGSNFQGALEMIDNPTGYNIYGLPNIYNKNSNGSKKTLFFFPEFINRDSSSMNKDGVSNVVLSILSECSKRYTIKYNSSDINALSRRKAEHPITFDEAILKVDTSVYPIEDLKNRLTQLDNNPNYLKDMWIGKLEIKDGEVKFVPDYESKFIENFPHKDNKLEGATCIKAMPQKDSSGKVPRGRYIAGSDPYDDDSSNTLSLGSIFILDLWTDDIVAEYTGRPKFASEYYEICRRLLLFYNAECNYENNKKGLYTYFSTYNSTYLLCDTLEYLKDKDVTKITYGNKSKGTANYSNTKAGGISSYGRSCIRNFLLKPYELNTIEVIDGEEKEVTTSIPNLYRIKYKALLSELSLWNSNGNFDRHDALVMLMLLREDKLRMNGGKSSPKEEKEDPNYLGNDGFFAKNFKISYQY